MNPTSSFHTSIRKFIISQHVSEAVVRGRAEARTKRGLGFGTFLIRSRLGKPRAIARGHRRTGAERAPRTSKHRQPHKDHNAPGATQHLCLELAAQPYDVLFHACSLSLVDTRRLAPVESFFGAVSLVDCRFFDEFESRPCAARRRRWVSLSGFSASRGLKYVVSVVLCWGDGE